MNVKLLNLGCGSRFHQDWVNVDFTSQNPAVMAHDLRERLPFEDASFDCVYHSHVLEHLPRFYAPMFCHECYRVLKPGGIIRVVVPDLEQLARIYLDLFERSLQGDRSAAEQYTWILIELFDQIARNHSGGDMLKYWKQDPMPARDFVLARIGSEALETVERTRESVQSTASPEEALSDNDDYETIGKFRVSGEVHQWMYDRYSVELLLRRAGFVNIKKCSAGESSIPRFNDYLLDREPDGSIRKPDSLFIEATKPAEESEAARSARQDDVRTLDDRMHSYRSGFKTKKGLAEQLEEQLKASENLRQRMLEAEQKLLAEYQKLLLDNIQLSAQLNRIRSSFLWKLLTPLRWVARHIFRRT